MAIMLSGIFFIHSGSMFAREVMPPLQGIAVRLRILLNHKSNVKRIVSKPPLIFRVIGKQLAQLFVVAAIIKQHCFFKIKKQLLCCRCCGLVF